MPWPVAVAVPTWRTGTEPIVGRVVVVGGGISGLATAWELSGGHSQVIVIESASRLGGALDSAKFGGRIVDTGPDGFLGRRPEALDLCHEIGLGDALVPIAGRGAGVWARGRIRPLPAGLALGIPTRFWPAARSGILGVRGQLGLARDVLLPRPDVRGPIGDRSIGPLVARKLGKRVADRLVDPLIGGIHAGSVDDMSAAATYPPLLVAAQKRGSLMRALRAEVPAPAPSDDAPPLFWALHEGMASLIEQLRVALVTRGVEIRCDTTVQHLERSELREGGSSSSSRWNIVTGDLTQGVAGPTSGGSIEADAIVLAVPAPVAASLLEPHDDEAAGLLGGISYASVTLVTFRVSLEAPAAPLAGTGFLVPRRSAPPAGGDAWAVTAVTYLSEKWPYLMTEGEVLLRASLGRYGDNRADEWSDEEVVGRAWSELGALMGLGGEPLEARVTRWPRAFPQYRVHHLMRTAGIEAAVARIGGIAVAGSAYRGVGIPACIASGRAAARAIA
jgi:protoporphyrinogen/coproporphyrinogen III oxidase